MQSWEQFALRVAPHLNHDLIIVIMFWHQFLVMSAQTKCNKAIVANSDMDVHLLDSRLECLDVYSVNISLINKKLILNSCLFPDEFIPHPIASGDSEVISRIAENA